jgi:hypothetical protein
MPNPPFPAAPLSNSEVEEQLVHLRAQLLRAEQEKELMRVKLEEEVAEREKAQKQVGRALWGAALPRAPLACSAGPLATVCIRQAVVRRLCVPTWQGAGEGELKTRGCSNSTGPPSIDNSDARSRWRRR